MGETASTIIKLLVSLVSPKTCVKYLVVAVSLVSSWIYVGEWLKELDENGVSIPQQQADIVILLVGIGVGGLLSFILFSVYNAGHNKWSSIKNEEAKNIEAERSKINKGHCNDLFKSAFISAIQHLKSSQVRALRQLTKGRANIDFSDSDNQILSDNQYIEKISCAYSSTYITQINPLIECDVVEHWKNDIESRVETLYNENPYAVDLLELLKTENADSLYLVDTKLFEHLSKYGDTCLHGDYGTPSLDGKENYDLWFGEYDEDVLEALERSNNAKYNGNIVIAHERLINNVQ